MLTSAASTTRTTTATTAHLQLASTLPDPFRPARHASEMTAVERAGPPTGTLASTSHGLVAGAHGPPIDDPPPSLLRDRHRHARPPPRRGALAFLSASFNDAPKSVLGEIPTRTFGPTAAYAFAHPAPAPAGALVRRSAGHLARRIHGWSWQTFPVAMGTGAVYVTIASLPSDQGLAASGGERARRVCEAVFYVMNLVFFAINLTTLALQAILYPRQARRLITDPSKNIYVPLVVLSFATIIIGTIDVALEHGIVGQEFIYVLFWIYVSVAVLVCFPLLMIWYNKPHDIHLFNPAWAFLVYPMMLVGVVSANVLGTMDPQDPRSVGVLLTGYFFQGIGYSVTFAYICIYFLRIMITGFMDGPSANSAFIAGGPPGFTGLALVKLGTHARDILPAHSLVSENAGEIWYAICVLSGLMLFAFSVFLVLFGALPYWFKLHYQVTEILGCWALTFPNVGWISTIGALDEALSIPGFFQLQVVCVCLLGAIWLTLAALTALAFHRGLILYDAEAAVLADTMEGFGLDAGRGRERNSEGEKKSGGHEGVLA